MEKYSFESLNKWCQQMSSNQNTKKQLDGELIKIETQKKKLFEEEDNLKRKLSANSKQHEYLVKKGNEMNLNFSDKCLEIDDAPICTKKLKLDLTKESISDEMTAS